MSFPGFIGKKVGMTQVFDEEGSAIPVTVLELLELVVTQVKTVEKDGYSAVQVGYVEAKPKHMTKARQGHLKKSELPLLRHLKEFRMEANDVAAYKVGDKVDLSFLEAGQALKVSGKSIGKGFRSGIQRWGHARGPMSHGSKSHRLPGSIGAGTTPGRVFKGVHMAGRVGAKTATIQNLKVVRVLPEKKALLVRGSVPGVEGGLLTVQLMAGRK